MTLLLAVLAGGLLFAGHPPLDQDWAGLLALAPLSAALRRAGASGRPWRQGLLVGGVTGMVFFGFLLSWIWRFGVVAFVLLIIVQAAFIAVYGAVVARWGGRRGRAVVAVVVWVGIEVARTRYPLGGFPWGLAGVTQHDGGVLLPAARVGGVVLVSALVASIGVAVETLVRSCLGMARRRAGTARGRAADLRAAGGAGAWLLALAVAVPLLPAAPAVTGRTIDVAAVQGNDIELPPAVDRLNRVRIERVVERMTAATERLIGEPTPDLVVWPENSLDNDYRDVPALRALVERAIDSIDGAPLVAGTLLDGPRPGTAYNTLVVIGENTEIVQTYRKRKLVPFGEYVPARSWLEWFPPLDQIPIDYLPGDGPQLFTVDGALVGPVTCFESVFAQTVHDQVRAGAEALIVSTNNASFGRTAASRQHLAFSQMRAVETGRWIMHAGISGISGVVDPDGVVSQRTDLFEQAVVRADLPLVDQMTTAMWLQPWLENLALAATVVVAAVALLRRRRDAAPRNRPVNAVVAEPGDGYARRGRSRANAPVI